MLGLLPFSLPFDRASLSLLLFLVSAISIAFRDA
jgi:NADH:ubiquinone oxidoreductase subunit 6 (subunit J)